MSTMRDVFIQTTSDWLDANPNVALVLADIGLGRFEALGTPDRHPDRVINAGIREALAVGLAAGLASEGMLPIVHTYAPFLVERAFEQIKLDFVHQNLRGLFVSIGASYDAAAEGRTHQAPGDVALLSTLPGMRIEVPGHPDEVEPALARGRDWSSASYVRLSTQTNPVALPGGVSVVRPGRKGTVLTIGPLLGPVLEATADLDVRILYTATARPIDEHLPSMVVPGAPLALVEPVLQGTSVAAVQACLDHRGPVYPIGVRSEELRRYGTPAQHAAAHGLDAAGLSVRLRRWLEGTAAPFDYSVAATTRSPARRAPAMFLADGPSSSSARGPET